MMPRETAVSKSSVVQVSPPGATRRWCVCIMMIALAASTGRVSAFSFVPAATKKAGFSMTKSGRLLQQRQPLQRSPGPWPLHRSISTPLAVSTSPPPPSTSSSTLTESLDVDHSSGNNSNNKLINLHTIRKEELEQIIQSWGYPKYRANQIWQWIKPSQNDTSSKKKKKGNSGGGGKPGGDANAGAASSSSITTIDEMNNLPKKLREQLKEYATLEGSLQLEAELISKDGTIKRAYKLHDGQLIESVLMPYEDGRYTACISSQAGCAQGCVFCATGM